MPGFFRKLFGSGRESAEAFFYRGLDCAEKGDPDRAIADWTKAVAIVPNRPDITSVLAWSLATCPDGEFRDGQEALCWGGMARNNRGSADAASAFKQARPEVAVALDCLDVCLDEDHAARAQRRTKRDAACRAELGPQARWMLDEAARIEFDKGLKALENQDFELAIVHFSQAISFDPNAVIAYVRRGCVYAGWGEFDKAIEDLSAAIGLNPELAEAYYSRGAVYREKNEHAKAEADFVQAKQLGCKPE